MIKCEAGETIRITGTFKDIKDELADPSTATCTIIDSRGKVRVNKDDLVRDSYGVWHYDYTIPEDGPMGTWLVTFIGKLETFTAKSVMQFDVEITTNI